jgi:hypothetical protein
MLSHFICGSDIGAFPKNARGRGRKEPPSYIMTTYILPLTMDQLRETCKGLQTFPHLDP